VVLPVWVELHQGARGRREEENLKGWREVSHWLEFDDDCWAEAAKTEKQGDGHPQFRCLKAERYQEFGVPAPQHPSNR
jgi:hypothetical protein